MLSATDLKGKVSIMYIALELSKYIVSNCIDEKHPISNLQLQKILYCVQREFLQHNNIAFADDIEAWQFGPVVPNVYYYFCGFGVMPISFLWEDCPILNGADETIINEIVRTKRQLEPWAITDDTNRTNGAWAQIYNNGIGDHNVIPRYLIQTTG